MSVEWGNVYWMATADSHNIEHLHVVASNPDTDPQNIVLLPLTTYEDYKEDSCILKGRDEGGKHPNIPHLTCVDYRRAKLRSVDEIEQALVAKRIRQCQPMCKDKMNDILAGADKSPFLPARYYNILAQQGLVK